MNFRGSPSLPATHEIALNESLSTINDSRKDIKYIIRAFKIVITFTSLEFLTPTDLVRMWATSRSCHCEEYHLYLLDLAYLKTSPSTLNFKMPIGGGDSYSNFCFVSSFFLIVLLLFLLRPQTRQTFQLQRINYIVFGYLMVSTTDHNMGTYPPPPSHTHTKKKEGLEVANMAFPWDFFFWNNNLY